LEAWHQSLRVRRHSSSRLGIKGPDLPKPSAYTLEPGQPTPGRSSLLRPLIAVLPGAGLLTGFPSITRFRLTLGADSPCADERCAGNLGLSAGGTLTPLVVTYVSIRTSDTSSAPYGTPSTAYGTLPYHANARFASAASVHGLSPGTSSAQADSTSELLRFL
jgi:hypothetical protein